MSRIYDTKQLTKITDFFEDFMAIFKPLDPENSDNWDDPLYIESVEIVIRHRDDYTVARIGMDDFPYVEFTDGEDPEIVSEINAVAAAISAHIRQEDTASGQKS